jgi:hypothetical protein
MENEMKAAFVLALGLSLVGSAQANELFPLQIVISSPASTTLTCTVNYPSGQTSFVEPVAAGLALASCTVAPSTWAGSLTLSGADASFFSVSGLALTVGSAPITVPRTYNVTLTASP